MTKPPLASALLTDPRLFPSSTRPAGIFASSTWTTERSLVISTTSYVSSTVQGTKLPTVSFNIFVSQNGTRRVELATT